MARPQSRTAARTGNRSERTGPPGIRNQAGAAERGAPCCLRGNADFSPSMTRRTFLQASPALVSRTHAPVLDPESFHHHEEFFRNSMPEEVTNEIPDSRAWDWMKSQIPLFTCPDRDVEQIYYFRWWTFRKHIK